MLVYSENCGYTPWESLEFEVAKEKHLLKTRIIVLSYQQKCAIIDCFHMTILSTEWKNLICYYQISKNNHVYIYIKSFMNIIHTLITTFNCNLAKFLHPNKSILIDK